MPKTQTSRRSQAAQQLGRIVQLGRLARSVVLRQGAIMGVAMLVAGTLDYGVNVVAGRWLHPVDYGEFVSVTAILQVLLLLSIAVRMVVAFYTAELSVGADAEGHIANFVRGALKWAWSWGAAGTLVMMGLSPFVSRALNIPSVWPVLAASGMVFCLLLRETTYGALQGVESFAALGFVQVLQALVRMVLAALLIWLGYQATGAIAAQPLSGIVGIGFALWWLWPRLRIQQVAASRRVSWHYSAHTVVGLAIFGLLTNLDPLFVKHFFSPQVAGFYGPVVTLAKISLFVPWAIGIVLFPKVTRRQASGVDPRPILVAALAAALCPGLLLSLAYFLFPGRLVAIVFSHAYANPGLVLCLASLSATLFAGVNIWLNYAMSLGRSAFVYALFATLVWQACGMFLFGRESLVQMTVVMVSAGLMGNVAGFVTTWFASHVPGPAYETAKSAAD